MFAVKEDGGSGSMSHLPSELLEKTLDFIDLFPLGYLIANNFSNNKLTP